MTLVSNGGTTTLGLYDTQSQLEKKADITYVDNKVDPLVGGHKGFATLALAQAAQGTLPAGSVVEVTNDSTVSNNGVYLWNGTTLTKSAYDPLTESKTYADETALTVSSYLKESSDVENGFSHIRIPIIVGENSKAIIDTDKDGNINFSAKDFEFRRGFAYKPFIFLGDDEREILQDSNAVNQQQLDASIATVNRKIKKEDQKLSGYGLVDFFEALRQGVGGRASIAFFGDSTTQGSDGLSIPDVVYKSLGKKIGYGGIGYVPFDPTAMCTYDSSSFPDVTFFFTKNDWKTWNYFQANPPSGYKGWGVKGGVYADASTVGMLELNLNLSRRNDYLGFNKFRLFYFAIDGSVTFTANGQEITVDATDIENPVVSNVLIENVGYDSLADPKLWRVQVQRTGGTGTLHLGGVELINSKGGVVVHRFAIGGYKAADHTGQSAVSQRAYYSALSIDLAIINLGQNDQNTDAATWKTQMQEIINRIRADASNRPILLVRWWTTALDSKDVVLNELAAENDLQIVDMRNVVPNAQWSVDKGINLTGVTTDPHLNAKGSNYAARYLLKHLNIESITENLRSA